MASWIVHLRVAEKLLAAWPELDPAQFAVGNIAPDSGIPDEKWEKFTPPPEVTHFKGEGALCGEEAFYHRYLATPGVGKLPGPPGDDPRRHAFLIGYFCHLATDNQWWLTIGEPTQKRWADQFAQDKDFIWEVKDDWYGLDFRYVRAHPECLFWKVFLTCAYEADYLDFLPVEAVRKRVEYIRTFYQRDDEAIQAMLARPYIYLSEGEMDAFVDATVQRIINHEYRE